MGVRVPPLAPGFFRGLRRFTHSLLTSCGTDVSPRDYTYRYGNRLDLPPPIGVSSSTNRLTGSGYSYDSAGNLTSEPGKTYSYDGEGRLATSTAGGVTTIYQYDGDGKRSVKTSTPGETRIYFYDVAGNPILESMPLAQSPAPENWLNGKVYFNGRHVWQNTTNGNFWRHGDHLGSARLRTDGNGASLGLSRYYPFGEEIEFPTAQPASLDNYQFTGKERDVETGLDNFVARMCSPELARFLSIDPARESFDPENPQTWNRYSYVLNNPLKFVDPDGRSPQLAQVAKSGALASAIPGPQQPFVIAGTAIVGVVVIAQNPQVQAAAADLAETLETTAASAGRTAGDLAERAVGAIVSSASSATDSLKGLFFAQRGKGRIKGNEFDGVDVEELQEQLRDPTVSKEQKNKIRRELKGRRLRPSRQTKDDKTPKVEKKDDKKG